MVTFWKRTSLPARPVEPPKQPSPPFHQDPSATAAFTLLNAQTNADHSLRDVPSDFKAVVIGGGTGAPMSIRTLLSMGIATNAVVAMADDGGSTGILREEANVTPPGDVRKCIVAMARNPEEPLVKALKYRFAVARNHTLGNLLLTALEDATQSFPEAIRICEQLVDARGHVYPSTLDHVRLFAKTLDGEVIDGQALASHSTTALSQVWLQAENEIRPYKPALDAIAEADLIVLGPGSLFTSIIPNLLVPGVIDAIRRSRGRLLFVCSLADVQGETWGLTAREHVGALIAHGMEGLIDFVLIHSPVPVKPMAYGATYGTDGLNEDSDEEYLPYLDERLIARGIRPVAVSYRDLQAIQAQGPLVMVRDLAGTETPTWHNPPALRDAFADVLRLCRSRSR